MRVCPTILFGNLLTALIDFPNALVYTLAHDQLAAKEKAMAILAETLKAMIRDYHGFELSDAEIELIRPELDAYLSALETLRDLDLSDVMSGRLLKAGEGDAAGG